MIVFNAEFLFVHNPKTAGTSLIEYLRKVLRPPVYSAGIRELGTYHPHLTLSLGYAAAITGTAPDRFKKILAVTRNPYDREVSMYFHFRDRVVKNPAFREDVNDARIEEAVLQSASLPFSSYLNWLRTTHSTCDIWDSRHYYCLQCNRIPAALDVVRMEDLEWKLPLVMDGFIDNKSEAVTLSHVNTTSHEPFASYYDTETEEFVFCSYRWMFEGGGYSRLHLPHRTSAA